MAKQTSKQGKASRTLPDPEAWVASAPLAMHSGKCWLCSRPDERAWVCRVLELSESGRKPVTQAAIHATLRDTVGYPYGRKSMMICAREHGRRG